MDVVISSGHGLKIRGAADILDEVDEARRVVDAVAKHLKNIGVNVKIFHDNTSTTQDQNLRTIVNYHNGQKRDLDISVHFNAYEHTERPMGTEVLYVSQLDLAADVSDAIAKAGGFIDRGSKKRTDLYFLNNTNEPAILIETCFVDSETDAELYRENFDIICEAIAAAIAGEIPVAASAPLPAETPSDAVRFYGKCSYFGGPDDTGVDADEGLAFLYDYTEAPHLFLPQQPDGTTGLARRLNPGIHYVACRWDYDVTSKIMLANPSVQALVRAGDRAFLAWPADWGPHEDTDRAADISPGLMFALGIQTDDEIEVIYPAPEMAWT
jgi:N-acetylmuramoyl-L-alanine amidase